MTVHYGIVVALIAAKTRYQARGVARRRGLQMGQWRFLSYETHRAFPNADLIVDATWADCDDPAAMESLIARRLTIASGKRPRLGARAIIARDGV